MDALSSRRKLKTIAIVLAGGAGSRVGQDLPKQLLKLSGKTIIEHTLDALERSAFVDEILVVMASAFIDHLKGVLKDRYLKLRPLVPGGADRNSSTRNALASIAESEAKVLFHDAVRPFVNEETLHDCVVELDTHDAVDVVIETADTIVEVDHDGYILRVPDRRNLRRGQTPQAFLLSVIKEAYEKASADPGFVATDDCSVVLKYLPSTPIATVRGSDENMKITYPVDLFLADRLFQLASSPARSLPANKKALAGRALVVVLGGSYGIGAEIVALATTLGATVTSLSRSETDTDVRNFEAVAAALEQTHQTYGRIDHVVNVAAILVKGPLVEMTVQSIREQLDINFMAPLFVARASFKYLRETRGSLLLFTSSSYTRGRALYSVYSSTKAAIVNLTQALADEWAQHDVRVNCINPERTRTPMRAQNFGEEPPSSLLSAVEVAESALGTLMSDSTGLIIDVRRDQDESPLAPTPVGFDESPPRTGADRGPSHVV